MKRFLSIWMILAVIFSTSVSVAAPLSEQTSGPADGANTENFLRNTRLIQQKNQQQLGFYVEQQAAGRQASSADIQLYLASSTLLPAELVEAAHREAGYVSAAQFLSPGHPADGAINNVYGAPTWIVPRENALAILALIESAEITGDASYLDRAKASADYLMRVQDADGGWFDQYDHATPVTRSKSPTQTAEVMLAFAKLGYDSARYESMKRGAEFLLACQDPANKGGSDDGLLCGGKDGDGNFTSWRWTSDNSFAYQALKAMQMWAFVKGDGAMVDRSLDASAKILNGINTYLYNADPADDDYGVWKRAIDRFGVEMEPWFHEWINYAPQMLDLPAIGVGSARVGQWIHDKFQREDGSVVWNDTWHTTRKSPGFSFQAAFVWYDLGQHEWADASVEWSKNSGLWQLTPDQNGISGGWIDWTEPADQAPFWQRFIDTSFYSVAAFRGGYDFSIGDSSVDILVMRLQDNDTVREAVNLLYGTSLRDSGNVSSADYEVLRAITQDPALRFETFFDVVARGAALYRSLQASAQARTDFNLLFGADLPAAGPPSASGRGKLFDVTGDPAFDLTAFLPVLGRTASLYRALQGSAAYRSDFNLLYAASAGPSGAPSAALRTVLFAVAGDPAFNLSAYLPVLTKTAALFRALRGTAAYRNDFNLLYAGTILSSGSPTAVDRTTLFAIAGTPGYGQSVYLSVLTKAASLYRVLQTNATYRADFKLLYGVNILTAGAPSVAARTEIFGVAGTSGYVQSKYLPILRKSSSLYQKLQLSTAKRLSFNSRYSAALPASGSPQAGDRGKIFNITGSPKYSESRFLASL